MQTTLFNPFRTLLCEEAPSNATPPGEQQTPPPAETETPAPAETDAPPPAQTETSFDFNADPENENPDDKTPETTNNEQEYTLELPDDLQTSDDFRALITQQAKTAGLDGKTAGKYVSGIITAMQQAETENTQKSTQQLKEEWGANFNANITAVKQFTSKLLTKSGLTSEDLAPLKSPKGYKLLHALMTTTGEAPFITGTNTPPRNNADEARGLRTVPQHPDYKARDDPQHPRHAEANRKYNKLVGLS
ncbi:MAG: hypothetical protein RR607_07880 [Akkermansia sp.]